MLIELKNWEIFLKKYCKNADLSVYFINKSDNFIRKGKMFIMIRHLF